MRALISGSFQVGSSGSVGDRWGACLDALGTEEVGLVMGFMGLDPLCGSTL